MFFPCGDSRLGIVREWRGKSFNCQELWFSNETLTLWHGVPPSAQEEALDCFTICASSFSIQAQDVTSTQGLKRDESTTGTGSLFQTPKPSNCHKFYCWYSPAAAKVLSLLVILVMVLLAIFAYSNGCGVSKLFCTLLPYFPVLVHLLHF